LVKPEATDYACLIYLWEVTLIIEVSYQTAAIAARKSSQMRRTEYFESSALPEIPAVIKELARMGKDFAPHTVLVSEHQLNDARSLKEKGFRITPL
jgi:hypothetical protein